jgi:uncharacterized protein (DUF427 family)
MSLLGRTAHETYCPYKDDCSYYSIPAGGDRSANAVWTYKNAFPAVTAIDGHLAFYPDRVDAIEVSNLWALLAVELTLRLSRARLRFRSL